MGRGVAVDQPQRAVPTAWAGRRHLYPPCSAAAPSPPRWPSPAPDAMNQTSLAASSARKVNEMRVGGGFGELCTRDHRGVLLVHAGVLGEQRRAVPVRADAEQDDVEVRHVVVALVGRHGGGQFRGIGLGRRLDVVAELDRPMRASGGRWRDRAASASNSAAKAAVSLRSGESAGTNRSSPHHRPTRVQSTESRAGGSRSARATCSRMPAAGDDQMRERPHRAARTRASRRAARRRRRRAASAEADNQISGAAPIRLARRSTDRRRAPGPSRCARAGPGGRSDR